MYQIISYQDKEEWDRIISLFDNKDVYFSYNYCELYRNLGDGIPHLFFYQDRQGRRVCYVFLKREIDLPFLNKEKSNDIYYDIITPYGYGGPLTQNGSEQLLSEFRSRFEHYCKRENIVSEFIRFHPLLKNHQHLQQFMDTSLDRYTIYIDLASDEDFSNNYHKNHLRNLKKAMRNGLEFQVFKKAEALDIVYEFYELYKETMKKLHASQYYYFSVDYMKSILNRLRDKSMIAAVYSEGRMIGAALCLYENGLLHYHLGCSKEKYLRLGTNVFLFHNIAIWGKENNLQSFHLGGGYGKNDSLFQFKQRFNQGGETGFYIGRKVHHSELYSIFTSRWEEFYSQKQREYNFFPAYRSTPSHDLVSH